MKRPRAQSGPERRHVLMLNWRDTGHPDGGGSEHFIEQVAQGLQADGYDVTLRCAHYSGASHTDRLGDVRVVRRGGRLTVYPRAMLHLLFRPGRYDLVVDVQNGVPFWTPLVTRTPVILLVHHTHRDQWPVVFGRLAAAVGWWLESRLSPMVYRRCRYATVSHTSRDELVDLGVANDRISVIYSGRDVTPTAPTDVAPAGRENLVVLGRLVPHKRVELAIEALSRLTERHPDATLTVIGQGWWEPQLRDLAERLGVAERVTFTGFVDDATKCRLLGEAWLHVLPSLKEGWGLAVVDAGSQRTPTIAYRSAGGTAESVIDGVTGVLLDDDDDLAAVAGMLLTHHALRRRMGHLAHEYAVQFTWQRTVDRFRTLVDAAIENGTWQLPLPTVPTSVPDPAVVVPLQRRPEMPPAPEPPNRLLGATDG